MRHDVLLFVLVPLYLLVIAALLIKDPPRLVATGEEEKAPVAEVKKAPVATEGKLDHAPQADESKRGLSPNCEKELRHTADLLHFFANRIHMGEDAQSVAADMRQQDKKISAVCD